MSKLVIVYALLGVGGVGAYSFAGTTGWEYSRQETRFVPKSVMATPGGYRSFHFWHVGYGGYRGGK